MQFALSPVNLCVTLPPIIEMMHMLKKIQILLILFMCVKPLSSQIMNPMTPVIMKDIMPEYGFLPGKKFPIYTTIDKYDFNGLKLKVEIYDDREKLKLNRVKCSEIELEHISEFSTPQTIFKLQQYVDSIFLQSGIVIDANNDNVLKIRLEAVGSRLIGFGSIDVHGLCQMKIEFNEFQKIYSTDIMDGDKNSPLGRRAFVTRKTASRLMTSAAIRECLEQFLVDLKEGKTGGNNK